MILSLHIKNIALIQELSIELGKGLNILSGETGAGKSIIIDSLNFVLGDRADRTLIRYGENMAWVEVVFENNNHLLKNVLAEYGIESEDEIIIINRKMTEGKSECRINGRIVTLSILRNVVCLLVDIHSQNEHQSLMKTSTQIKLLDEYSPKTIEIKAKYTQLLKEYYEYVSNLEQYSTEEDRNRNIELLNFQINEIEKSIPYDGEEEKLATERTRYYNFQKISTALGGASEYLDGGMGAVTTLARAYSELSSIIRYDESLSELIDRLDIVNIEVDDITQTIKDKMENEGIDTIDIGFNEKRLEELRLLKKKYGKSIEEIEAFLNVAKDRLYMLENSEKAIASLEKKLRETSKNLISYAKSLHLLREQSSKAFSTSIVLHLSDLGMKNTVFEIALNFPQADEDILNNLTANGADKVEFLLSPNLGEPVKSLSKIASGGEMSRFMLALKNVIADIDDIDTLVFDEIDSGVSGKIAKEVAKKLFNIAKTRQVIAITHLPQLASMADNHYLISKSVVNEKTITELSILSENDTYLEIMRLAGSAENSDVGLSHAKEMKSWAHNYKKSIL